nr:hypothetical protein [Tanacetum cinerariifolium]
QVTRRSWRETAVGAHLHLQLLLDAFQVIRIRIDLALVLQGDVLLGVLFAGDDKRQRATATAHLLGRARLDRQRDANDCQPAG